jgi:putative transposase
MGEKTRYPVALHSTWLNLGRMRMWSDSTCLTVRHDWLGLHLFAPIEHGQDTATQWPWRYSTERPNMELGGITPYQKLKETALVNIPDNITCPFSTYRLTVISSYKAQ